MLSGARDWSTLLFYTMISNLLCLGWMLLLIRTARDLRRRDTSGTSTRSARGSGAVMTAITVTMRITLIPYAYLVFGFIYGALGGEFTSSSSTRASSSSRRRTSASAAARRS